MRHCILAVLLALLATGCASSYTTPGRGADMHVLGVQSELQKRQSTDASVQAALDKKPLASFPSAVAVARVQSPGYHSMTADGYGTGKYSVVTTRDIEADAQVERLNKLPMLLGVAPVNRMLLSSDLQSDKELRQAAAQLHADLLLIYTLDTTFDDADNAKPLTLITLGLAPVRTVRVNTTASAVLMDTRNGYIYGVAEATERQKSGTNLWQTDTAVDSTRRDTESKAFEKLVSEFEKTWHGVLTQYAAPSHPPIVVQ